MTRPKRSFGSIRKLPSGRYQATYSDPQGTLSPSTGRTIQHRAPYTFDAREDAEAWLVDVRRTISRGEWQPPDDRSIARKAPVTFEEYATRWLERRSLKPRTRQHYRSILTKQLIPTFGRMPLKSIDAEDVATWHHQLGDSTPTLRAHSYGLLRTILGSALQDQLIPHNPCHIRGAGNAKRQHRVKPANLAELETIATEMPANLQAMVLLAAWCALRFGELAELRRKDVDLKNKVIHVRRGVVLVDGERVVGTPKSDAGTRDVAIPPHLVPLLREHIKEHAQWGRDGLLFPGRDGQHLAPSTLYGRAPVPARGARKARPGSGFYGARAAAGRPDLRFHDLRHTGAVLAAQTGATLAELMGRLGHSTPGAAMRYQHAAADRDRAIADALSALATGGGPA